MWLLRRLIFATRPRARALKRFRRAPSLAYISTIFKSDVRAASSFSAFAVADLTSFETRAATGPGRNWRIANASSTFLPRTRSMIGLTFFTEIPVSFAVAVAANSTAPFVPYSILVVRSDLVEWPRNVRANSPIRCPTMFSVMNTGTCLRPS